jgi:hypothetical protein
VVTLFNVATVNTIIVTLLLTMICQPGWLLRLVIVGLIEWRRTRAMRPVVSRRPLDHDLGRETGARQTV